MINVFEDSLSQQLQKLSRGRGELQHDYPHLRDLKPLSVMDRSLQQRTVRLTPKELPKAEKK